MRPSYLYLPSIVNVTSDPSPAAVAVALFAAAAFRKPCGVVQISASRSSTAAGCAVGAGGVPPAAPATGARFHACVPLINWMGRCTTGAGRTRPGSTICWRTISTRAAGDWYSTAAVKRLTSNGGQGSVGFGACPNWNQQPVPEYSIARMFEAPRAEAAPSSVPARGPQPAAAVMTKPRTMTDRECMNPPRKLVVRAFKARPFVASRRYQTPGMSRYVVTLMYSR